MTLIRDLETVLPSQDLPPEFLHLCSAHQSDEPKIAGMLSGVIAARQEDSVICRHMLRRNLVFPASHAGASPGAARAE
jgi:hypothetical protein